MNEDRPSTAWRNRCRTKRFDLFSGIFYPDPLESSVEKVSVQHNLKSIKEELCSSRVGLGRQTFPVQDWRIPTL